MIVEKRGYLVHNVDSTVILEKPKIAAYADEMSTNIAKALEMSTENISIKAKTNEGMGFAGRQEGVVAYAVVMVRKRGIE